MTQDESASTANFDRVARLYRWCEYLIFGPVLQRTRVHFLPLLADRCRALLLGDGDGRFTACLLAQNPGLNADAVDTSQAMLTLLRRRASAIPALPGGCSAADANPRLRTYNQSALNFTPNRPYDLVATLFFLDCLTQPELESLIRQLAPALTSHAFWLVSDFRIPAGFMRLPARILVRSLYFAFKLLTGLRVDHLPIHEPALKQAGFVLRAHHHRLFGLVTAELWQRAIRPPPASE